MRLEEDARRICFCRTSHSGYCAATSLAQSAPPHPQSSILSGHCTGGKISLPSNTSRNSSCVVSRRATSCCRVLSTAACKFSAQVRLKTNLIYRPEIGSICQGVFLIQPSVNVHRLLERCIQRCGSIASIDTFSGMFCPWGDRILL
jgi:hypothetical protein